MHPVPSALDNLLVTAKPRAAKLLDDIELGAIKAIDTGRFALRDV